MESLKLPVCRTGSSTRTSSSQMAQMLGWANSTSWSWAWAVTEWWSACQLSCTHTTASSSTLPGQGAGPDPSGVLGLPKATVVRTGAAQWHRHQGQLCRAAPEGCGLLWLSRVLESADGVTGPTPYLWDPILPYCPAAGGEGGGRRVGPTDQPWY